MSTPDQSQSRDPFLKTMKEKLAESIHLLSKLKETGVLATDPGYKELSQKLSAWVKADNEPYKGTIDFLEYSRRAVVNLPTKKRYMAKIDFLHHNFDAV